MRLCWDVRHADREFYTVGRGSGLSRAARENNEAYGRFHRTACGLCAVYRLERAGVAAAKIVGRSDDSAYILRDIEAVVRNVEIARACADEQEYLERMRRAARARRRLRGRLCHATTRKCGFRLGDRR